MSKVVYIILVLTSDKGFQYPLTNPKGAPSRTWEVAILSPWRRIEYVTAD
jgi:hypothetical protein